MNHETIIAGLRDIECQHNCRVLFAAESGSRAWGFPSPDSDYDVRFFYVHPPEWYLRLDDPKDTLEWFAPGDLDYSGWELRKALRLFAKCNQAMNEQLASPIVYESNGDFAGRIRELIPVYFNPIRVVHRYISTAKPFTVPLFQGEPVGIRSVFYILRPLLGSEWVIQFRTMPPTEFVRVLDGITMDTDLRQYIDALIVQKETVAEKDKIAVPPPIVDWIRSTCKRLPKEIEQFDRPENPGWEPLQRLMNDMVFAGK